MKMKYIQKVTIEDLEEFVKSKRDIFKAYTYKLEPTNFYARELDDILSMIRDIRYWEDKDENN